MPNAGQIYLNLDGQKIKLGGNLRNLQENISYVSSDIVIIEGTIEQNILYGTKSEYDSKYFSLLMESPVGDFIDSLPKKRNTLINENNTELSAGQKQKIAIFRALLRKPKILILDEATSQLDVESEKLILNFIKRSLSKTTIIATSHRKTYSSVSNQIFDLDKLNS